MALKSDVLKEYLSVKKSGCIIKNSRYKNYRVFDDPIIELSKNKKYSENINNKNKYFSSLSGYQRKFLLFIYECCKKSGSRCTEPLSVENISINCDILKKSIKKIAQRLEKQKKVIRIEFKAGRGGWTQYELPVEVYNEIMRYDNDVSALDLNIKSYYSEKNDKPHVDESISNLPEDWENIQCKSLREIGFSKSQLRQLYNKKLNTAEVIQESINHFAFGLDMRKDKYSKYSDPLSVLMSVLRDGGAWIEKDYRSPKDIAIKKVIDEKKRQKENNDKMIKEFVDLEFPEWEKQLSDKNIKEIVTEHTLKLNITSAIKSELRVYFIKNILLPKLENMAQ